MSDTEARRVRALSSIYGMNQKEFKERAAKSYVARGATVMGFQEDYARFSYIKRLMNRWEEGDEKPHLIVNHLVVLFTVFDPYFVRFALRLLFPEQKDWLIVNSAIAYLGREYDRVSVSPDLLRLIDESLDEHSATHS